jgi:hypothetical protein
MNPRIAMRTLYFRFALSLAVVVLLFASLRPIH